MMKHNVEYMGAHVGSHTIYFIFYTYIIYMQ